MKILLFWHNDCMLLCMLQAQTGSTLLRSTGSSVRAATGSCRGRQSTGSGISRGGRGQQRSWARSRRPSRRLRGTYAGQSWWRGGTLQSGRSPSTISAAKPTERALQVPSNSVLIKTQMLLGMFSSLVCITTQFCYSIDLKKLSC